VTRPAALAPWIPPTRSVPGAARVTLICFPHAGGGASAYRQWPHALAERGIEVWPVQLPGRESRHGEQLLTDLTALNAMLYAILAPRLSSGRPYAVYGHSAGAWMALAFTLHAVAMGSPWPHHLFLGACRPPDHPDPDFPIHRLPPAALRAKLLGYGGIPAEAFSYPELLERIESTARADLRLVESHQWSAHPQVDCPVTVVGGAQDSTVPVGLLSAWRTITRGRFEVTVLPDGHFPTPAAQRQLMTVLADALD
jgi:medium-chain acyl-[acyl-carrier-protein] hydrolase